MHSVKILLLIKQKKVWGCKLGSYNLIIKDGAIKIINI